jgi:hypothetical protein
VGGDFFIQGSKFVTLKQVKKSLPASSLPHVYSIATDLLAVKNGIVVTADSLSGILRAWTLGSRKKPK